MIVRVKVEMYTDTPEINMQTSKPTKSCGFGQKTGLHVRYELKRRVKGQTAFCEYASSIFSNARPHISGDQNMWLRLQIILNLFLISTGKI